MYYIFFFKQKTAYEMRISDWSSDVCSSDLRSPSGLLHRALLRIGRLSCTWRWKRTHATCPWGCARTRAAETVRPSEPLGRGLLRQARIPGRRAPDGRCRGRPVGKLENEQVVDG